MSSLRLASPASGRRLALRVVFLTLALSLFSGAHLAAESNGSLTGHVVPTHDHDFILSTARIPDLGLRVDVASDGSFRFDSVRPGRYVVEVRVPSLGVAVDQVEIRPGETTEVELTLKAGSHSDEIVVTGTAEARSPLDLASPTVSLSGAELERLQASSLGETLSGEPGISSTFFGPGASRPVIRGLTGDRVRMLEGGIGTGDASGISADHAVTADPAQADRIEVIRGPATLLYGSSAIGGVVNVLDERIPTTRSDGEFHGNIELRAGTNADERGASIGLDGGGGNWAWHVDALVRESDDYEVPGFARVEGDEHDEHDDDEHDDDEHDDDHGDEHDDDEHEEPPFGFVPNTDIDTQGGRVGATYFFGDRGFLGVSVSGFETDYGLPGGLEHAEHGDEHDDEHDDDEHEDEHDDEHDDDEHDDDHGDEHDDHGDEHDDHGDVPVRIDMEQRRFDLRGQVNRPFAGIEALKVRFGITDYEHVELEGGEDGTFFFNEAFEGRIEAVQTRRGGHGGSFGLQYLDRDLEAIGAEAFLPPTTTSRWSVFTLQEVESGPVLWQLGARFESQDVDPSAASGFRSVSHDGVSGSAGMVWKATDVVSFAASLARSVKLPAAEELFSNGPHIASQAFEIGDPTLGEESGLGLDLSLRWKSDRVQGEVTAFHQDFSDFIYQAFTGEVEDGFPVVLYSQDDAEFTGVELKSRFELWAQDQHHLHLRLTGDLVDAELDSGDNLPRIPPMRFGAGLHYHSEIWNASVEAQWTDDQDDLAENETPTDGFTMVHASLSYRFLLRNQIIDLMVRGRNLTDEEARSHTSFLKDVAPLPGRDISFALKFQF